MLPSALRELCSLLGEGGGATPRRVRARTASGAGGDGEGQGAEDGPEDGPARRRIYDAVLRGDERTLLLNSINPAARTAPEGASATALVRSAATPKTLVGVLYEPLHFVRILLTSFDSLPLTSWTSQVGLTCWRESARDAEEGADAAGDGSRSTNHQSTTTRNAPRYVFTSELRAVRTHDAPGRAR